jgi:hypothetical protein
MENQLAVCLFGLAQQVTQLVKKTSILSRATPGDVI